MENTATGDLDGDGLPDAAFVLRRVDQRYIAGRQRADLNPRVLVVVLRKPALGYVLAVENETLIPTNEVLDRTDLPDATRRQAEPDIVEYYLDGLKIEHGLLVVSIDWDPRMGVVGAKHTFQFRSGRLLLTKYSKWREGPQGESRDEEADFVGERLTIRHDSIRSRPHHEKYFTAIGRKPLLSIEQVGNARDFYYYGSDKILDPALKR